MQNSNFEANNIDTVVNLIPYQYDMYIFPNDGYIHFVANTADTELVVALYGANDVLIGNTTTINFVTGWERDCIYVKKGMKCTCSITKGQGLIEFYPLVN